jgi:hypothetical protein
VTRDVIRGVEICGGSEGERERDLFHGCVRYPVTARGATRFIVRSSAVSMMDR